MVGVRLGLWLGIRSETGLGQGLGKVKVEVSVKRCISTDKSLK